jgi:hypothetical protein
MNQIIQAIMKKNMIHTFDKPHVLSYMYQFIRLAKCQLKTNLTIEMKNKFELLINEKF